MKRQDARDARRGVDLVAEALTFRPWRSWRRGVLFLWVAACASRPPRLEPPPDEDVHAAPGERAAPRPIAVDAATARRELEAALQAHDDVKAVALANRLADLGQPVTEPARIDELVDHLSARQLEEAAALLQPRAAPGPRVAFRRVALAVHVGDLARARGLLPLIADPALATQAQRLVEEAAGRATVAPNVIGVLLPLSGRHAALGKELKLACEIAAAGRGVELAFVDTAGDEVRAAGAFDELVDKRHPLFVLGPVGEREAAAAAARAAALGVPIGLLTPAEGIADAAAGVFRLVSSGPGRARAAARFAVAHGFGALAVLAPRDDQGRAQAEAFAEAARAAGARLVASGTYDPTGTELEPDVKRFLGLDPATNERLRRHLARDRKNGLKTFSPDVEFDLLFVPDAYERASLLAAFLVFYNVELRTGDDTDSFALRKKHGGRLPSFVQLLGSAAWHHPQLLLRGGANVEGALVVNVWGGGDAQELPGAAAAALDERFRARTGRGPSAVAAEAYDALRLVLSARARSGAPGAGTRAALLQALRQTRLSAEDAAAGACGLDAAGELQRDVTLLRVDNGEFVLEE